MTATAEIPPTRAEINRRNAQRSTGPKTQAGKERSRFNALKHGCRARLPILPGEDPDAYQDRLDAWIGKFQPRDAVETYMVERAVHASWQLDRADRAEVAAMVEAADELALRRARDVLELGATLFRAPARVRDGDPESVRGGDESILSWPFDPEHPRHPVHVVDELEGSAQGCTWLLQRWAALGKALDGGRTWRAVDRLRAIRLLGKQPLDAVADETVLSIYLACQAMDPDGPDVFAEPLSDLRRPEAATAYQRQAERFAAARAERSPRDAAAGRAALRAIVSAAVARVEALREDRAAAEAEAAGLSEVSARLSYRAKETVEWLWKHQARCSRSLCRTFDELRKVRRDFGDDLPPSPGPMSVVRGPSSGSELVERSDLLATGAEPAAIEPAGDHDARDVTNEAIALAESFSVTKDHGQQPMDRTNEAIAPSEPPPVTSDDAPRTSDQTNEAIAPPEPLPVTRDDGPGTTNHGPGDGRRRADQNVIVLALLALFFSTVVAAALGTWVPARATAPRAFPDHRPRPEGHGDHNVTNEANPVGGPAIIVAGFRRDAPGTTGTDRGPMRRPRTVPLIPLRAPPPRGTVTLATCRETGLPPGIAGLRVCAIKAISEPPNGGDRNRLCVGDRGRTDGHRSASDLDPDLIPPGLATEPMYGISAHGRAAAVDQPKPPSVERADDLTLLDPTQP